MWSAKIQLMGKILFKSDVWNKLLEAYEDMKRMLRNFFDKKVFLPCPSI